VTGVTDLCDVVDMTKLVPNYSGRGMSPACALCGSPKDAHCAPELFCDYNQVPGDKSGIYTSPLAPSFTTDVTQPRARPMPTAMPEAPPPARVNGPRRPPPTPMPRPVKLWPEDIEAPQFRLDQHLWLWRVYLVLAAAAWTVIR
jgi:hypothetical protein